MLPRRPRVLVRQTPSRGLEKIRPPAISYSPEEALMRMVLVIAAVMSIAFGLVAVAVGRAWYDFRPLTDEERARLRQEGN
jgi:hypothetical protein